MYVSADDVLRVHRLEELAVGLRRPKFVDQELDAVHGAHRVQDTAEHVDLLELILRNQQVFLTRTRARHIDRREDALVGNLAVQNDFRVAGTLELFEDDFVHARAGIDQAPLR